MKQPYTVEVGLAFEKGLCSQPTFRRIFDAITSTAPRAVNEGRRRDLETIHGFQDMSSRFVGNPPLMRRQCLSVAQR